MNPQTNGATSRDWLQEGMKIIAYVECDMQFTIPPLGVGDAIQVLEPIKGPVPFVHLDELE